MEVWFHTHTHISFIFVQPKLMEGSFSNPLFKLESLRILHLNILQQFWRHF